MIKTKEILFANRQQKIYVDTVIEISVSSEADMKNPHFESDRCWYELANVEVPENPIHLLLEHCLLIAGKVTMC